MTRYLGPEPIRRATAGRLGEAAARVAGRTLAGVRYRFPEGTPWPTGYARGRLDEVDMAVLADFDHGVTLVCSWATDGFDEGVDVEAGPGEIFGLAADRESEFVADGFGPWSELRGDVLSGLDVVWQQRSEYAVETAWGLRLTFRTGRAVLVLLGGLVRGRAKYQADGLIVFFDAEEADAYQAEYANPGL